MAAKKAKSKAAAEEVEETNGWEEEAMRIDVEEEAEIWEMVVGKVEDEVE